MGPCGDPHNFGRLVEPVHLGSSNEDLYYSKPRTVFWEKLFFGATSPLTKIFEDSGPHFKLEFREPLTEHQNFCRAVHRSQSKANESLGKEFGSLLAYSFAFGLQDLHVDNMLRAPWGLQVVDVEQVFSDLSLPSQTLMLPLDENLLKTAALNHLGVVRLQDLPVQQAEDMFLSFNQFMALIYKKSSDCLDVFAKHSREIASCPNRVFVRRTKDYVDHLSGVRPIDDLFPEEQIQIDRGDVPYFFGFINSPKVYFYTSKNWDFSEVQVPQKFHKYLSYAAKTPEQILNPQSLEDRWARGALYLMSKIPRLPSWIEDSELFYQWQVQQSQWIFRGPTKVYAAQRLQ